ncbi:VOC family protein [Actinoplanes sp. M2I2]|uniref:VOC family protein n=1 Tax=Actinoplanes sp. M2I2 TaxID=1734444 RepID=UPI00201FC6B2|nr:VOC family protein [Actinoplanes sp. M2I2]
MPTIQTIIATPFFDRQRAFYQGVFGAVEKSRYPADGDVFYVAYTVGDSELGLVNEPETEHPPSARIAVSIAVADVDALLDRVEKAGGEVLGPPNDMPWGERVAHIHDPDGNVINLTQTLPR